MNEDFHLSSKKADAGEWMQEVVTLSMYYDFYGELLSERNKVVFEDYILNDMSLGEIAEESGLTRQGVYDIVRRCSKKLHEYEDKLKLVERFVRLREKITEISSIADEIGRTEDKNRHMSCVERIRELATQVESEL